MTYDQQINLLLITAVLTGVLVPSIKLFLDYMKERRAKKHDAALARQEKIVEDQIKLAEELTRLVWEYQFLCLKVSYYKALTTDRPKYVKACEDFDANSWSLLSQIRTEISKAKRLTTPSVYARLNDFYNWLNGVDSELASLIQTGAGLPATDDSRRKRAEQYTSLPDKEKWGAFHKTLFYGGGKEIDETLAGLAADMGLAREGSVSAGEFASGRPERFLKMVEQWVVKEQDRRRTEAQHAAGLQAAPALLSERSPEDSGMTAAEVAGNAGARVRAESGRE